MQWQRTQRGCGIYFSDSNAPYLLGLHKPSNVTLLNYIGKIVHG